MLGLFLWKNWKIGISIIILWGRGEKTSMPLASFPYDKIHVLMWHFGQELFFPLLWISWKLRTQLLHWKMEEELETVVEISIYAGTLRMRPRPKTCERCLRMPDSSYSHLEVTTWLSSTVRGNWCHLTIQQMPITVNYLTSLKSLRLRKLLD